MAGIFKIFAGAIVAVILVTALKQQNRELSLVLTLAACALILVPGMRLLKGIVDFVEELRISSGVERTVIASLLKICGIGLLTRLTALFCNDAGQSAVASAVELCGNIASVAVMLPVLQAVLSKLQGLLGA